ncbi:hypothetical protein [Paraburkholderia caribensis]|uniref:hypothetical protein n=1 Tax=Paraburkholderia caribensis TaxID=75105 RepID=UPI0034D2991D
MSGIPGQTNLVAGPLLAPLPDIGGLLFIRQALFATDVDDNVLLSISLSMSGNMAMKGILLVEDDLQAGGSLLRD